MLNIVIHVYEKFEYLKKNFIKVENLYINQFTNDIYSHIRLIVISNPFNVDTF